MSHNKTNMSKERERERERESREANTGEKEKKNPLDNSDQNRVKWEVTGEGEKVRVWDLLAAIMRTSSCDLELELSSAYGLFRAEIESD